MNEKDTEKVIEVTLDALYKIRGSFNNSIEPMKDNPVINKTMPFFVIAIDNLMLVVDEYIKQYESFKDNIK